jgi:hypothetical protein
VLALSAGQHGIEDLLAERDITVTRKSIRIWWIKFGAGISAD